MSALQRSRSSFQLHCSKEGDTNQDLPLRQEIQEIMDPLQDTSSNRSYRESLKDGQSNVLWSTSFRQRDFSSSVSPPAPAAPSTVSSSSSQQPPPVPTKYHSLEKKGPKTLHKPLGVVITPQSLPSVTSPHMPKERYVVCPDIRGLSPPALPSVPPVGPLPVTRICGRKRLPADQKKRSYSEPENMNEVGVSDAETAALFRRGVGKNLISRETSVTDQRKMFELAASPVGAPQSAISKPDLRQVRQEALFEYVERKRRARREERSGSRPCSAYVQPEQSSLTACYSDSISLSSTSGLLSLQDYGPDGLAGERHLCSTHPPGTDLRSLQSNLFYPGRVTTPRPRAHPSPSASLGSDSCPNPPGSHP